MRFSVKYGQQLKHRITVLCIEGVKWWHSVARLNLQVNGAVSSLALFYLTSPVILTAFFITIFYPVINKNSGNKKSWPTYRMLILVM